MFNKKLLDKYIDKGLLMGQSHPDNPNVWIYNYTPQVQFERAWDDVTLNCRGLIIDWSKDKIIARPFPKFFNYGEVEVEIPNEEPIITDKLDGSLGIYYELDGKPYIATRGSFTSDQAIWATNWWRKNMSSVSIPDGFTPLFEIIYPENRIVVKYDWEGLAHLATLDIDTGKQILDHKIDGLRTPEVFPPASLDELKKLDGDNREGFVVYYPSKELRLKIKFDQYVRLHKIMTGLTPLRVYEVVSNGEDIYALIADVPDEMYATVDKYVKQLKKQYAQIEKEAKEVVEKAKKLQDRAEQAKFILQNCKYKGVCFKMLDGKDYSQAIWKQLKPRGDLKF